ncbi:MAG: hypothetical protein M1541_07035 [Acidobacteria bacterium]|nr:hypothetical protein [Acidobacteriota bacterium]
MKYFLSLIFLWCLPGLNRADAQSTGATFGNVVRLGGTPSDIVLDESRARLYLVNQTANRVDIYSYADERVIGSIPTGSSPLSAAMSMDNAWLYVTNNQSSSLTVISLASNSVVQTVTLPAKPEGVEVGADGRVLVSTEGTGTSDAISSLVLFDRNMQSGQQVTAVNFPPPPATPSPLPATTLTRPITTFRGKLIRTPDGMLIIGLSTVNNNASTVLFVYETASASVLRSRTVTGQSTVLSVSPDGSRFMAGSTLYDTATLAAVAQQNVANVPFPLSTSTTATFNLLQNLGGSAFSPDGETLYSAFNVAPFSQPATRPQASTLLISSSRHLGARLGIKIPESIIAKMALTSDGADAWGLSESGLIHLPLGTLYDYPILQPETTTVFLAVDACNRGLASSTLRITNAGKGKLTFSVPDTTAALVAQASSGVTPSAITFTLEPGRTNVTRQYGTNLYSGAVSNSGTPVLVNLASPEAINIPPTIKVYMNMRQSDQRGVIYPVVTGTSTSEGLQDAIADEARDRVYVTNSGYNRIEVFDRLRQRFLTPIEVGQLPHQMALGGDGRTLYVANTGGESISVVDLKLGKVIGGIQFSPIPRSGTASPITPQAIAMSAFGLQAVMSDGSQWEAVNNQLTVRPADSVTPVKFSTTTQTGPPRMIATPGGLSIMTMAANGTTYLYDGLSDAYTVSNRPYTTQTTVQGYYGPLAAGPQGTYFLMNGFILNSALSAMGGSDSPSSTQAGPLASRRNIAAVAAIDGNTFLRLTTPVKQNLTSTPASDPRPTLEMVDLRDNSINIVGAVAENPVSSLFGTARINVPPRQIAVDSKGTAYAITLSGLSVIPLTASGASRPQIAGGAAGVINANDGADILPGSFLWVSGQNLATTASATQVPAPTVLGGSCVMLGNVAAPLIQTSPGQIVAQLPDNFAPGPYVLQVRSLATGQQSDPVLITVK